jgi:hypothetical protein
LRRAAAGPDHHTLRGGAGHDHGLDAAVLEPLLERRAEELVGPALVDPFAVLGGEALVHEFGRLHGRRADQGVEHHRACGRVPHRFNRLTLGTLAKQRGRAPQPVFISS